MTRLLGALLLALALAGAPQTAHAEQTPPGFPPNLRYDLVPTWIKWAADKAQISWPPDNRCATAPIAQSLTPGDTIDRFGSEFGTFFSPRGEAFRSRAVPYVCSHMDYRVYRVVKPVAVKSCKAAPWFDEPGGAVQVHRGARQQTGGLRHDRAGVLCGWRKQ